MYIIAAYENTGRNTESQNLHDQIQKLIPPDSESPLTDFESISTTLNIFINAISNLPIDFRTIYSDKILSCF